MAVIKVKQSQVKETREIRQLSNMPDPLAINDITGTTDKLEWVSGSRV